MTADLWLTALKSARDQQMVATTAVDAVNQLRPVFPASGQAILTLRDDGGLSVERKDTIHFADVPVLIDWLLQLYPPTSAPTDAPLQSQMEAPHVCR